MASQLSVSSAQGSSATVPADATAREALQALGLIRGQVLAARLDGVVCDLERPVPDGATVEPVPADSDEGREILRHSVAHIMAQAVTDLYPGAKFAIGPPITDGFYYDFDVADPFTPEDLERIENRMHEIIRENQAFRRRELSRDEALELFADQPYKREIIERATSGAAISGEEAADVDPDADAVISVYDNVRPDGSVWPDLCRGPHIPTTKWVPAFKLQRVAGAYWRGDENRPMLQRIYGTAWESRKALAAHLERLEQARKRDHRKLGRELDLISFPDELGAGLAVWHPRGAIVRQEMEDYIRAETRRRGYQPVYTPHLTKGQLFETSGHLSFYAEGMYPPMEMDTGSEGTGTDYYPKPMNCPFHVLIYKSRQRSYRELPLRLAELGTVYRYERSGVIHGLMRARGFTQDDSHIFCTADQIVGEVLGCLEFALDVYRDFGFTQGPSRVALSTRPPKAETVGTDQEWEHAEDALRQALDQSGLDYVVDEGEGAFYGPKIDLQVTDAIGRAWQLTTVQVDFNHPQRFDLEYTTPDGTPQRPYMVHRALYGSLDRFFGILLEHYAGAFPLWLAPVQAVVVPVSDRHHDYGAKVAAALADAGIRAELDDSADTMGAKIRKHQLAKVPYQLIVGDSEAESDTVAVRPRAGDQRKDVPLPAAVDDLVAEVRSKGAAT
ncbi:MAG TPA: threonine--tRNA ligase [Egibacteraceae bacterium]|nr:threonine--tRNA ligase [Egibacteraceae bacterium]